MIYAKIGVGKSTVQIDIRMWHYINNPALRIDMTISVEEFVYSDEYCGGIPQRGKG
jgi:NADH-quinone oxidoreductase subunit F